jgi:hypothetical protein
VTGILQANLPSERVAITCPLGVRLFDVATNIVVSDDLLIQAYQPQNATRRVDAVANRSGVWAFHGLPGLRRFEYDPDDERRWTSGLPVARTFVIEVIDKEGRFLPCRFLAEAPARVQSSGAETGSPPGLPLRTVPLFSSPARALPGGLAVVRTQFFEATTEKPAPWVLTEVSATVFGRIVTARGLADRQGRLALIFPYPEPANVSLGSPPGGGPQLLSEQRWTLNFRAWYNFDLAPADFADLDSVLALAATSPVTLLDLGSPSTVFANAELVFSRELIVPERLSGDFRPRSLFISPADSPP